MNNFTNDLCANLLKATPQANSPSPEFALEIATLIRVSEKSCSLFRRNLHGHREAN